MYLFSAIKKGAPSHVPPFYNDRRDGAHRNHAVGSGLPPSQLRIGIVYAMWNQYFVREPRNL